MDGFAAGDAAAGAVDRQDDRLDLIVVSELVDRFGDLAILGDQAVDGDAGDVRAPRRQAGATKNAAGSLPPRLTFELAGPGPRPPRLPG